MALELAKVHPAFLEAIQRDPQMLARYVFPHHREDDRPEPDAEEVCRRYGYSFEDDFCCEDDAVIESGGPWEKRASGEGATVELDYEFNYGQAYVLSCEEVSRIAASLEEGDLKAFFEAAAREQKAIIGGWT